MFIALLLLVFFYGCRISKSTVEKHKESFSKEDVQINKFDSISKMKYYIIAGEASGDLHGANLMKSLYQEDPNADIRFWGKLQQ